MRIRVIPILLLHKGGLVKSVKFKDYKYVGDPINAVKIFNEKEADEIAIIDIQATSEGRPPDLATINEIVSEAFMPVGYGGGISTIAQVKEIFSRGVEKVILNKAAHANPGVIAAAAEMFGSQSVVVSIDVKKSMLKGYRVYTDNGNVDTNLKPIEFARKMESLGAGELIINSIDRDGTYKGYDTELIAAVAEAVAIPVIALGGAGAISDFVAAKQSGASAVAAGSMFVFKRPHQAVLISYPTQEELKEKLFRN